MHEWGTRMLLKQYLDQGLTKAELSRRFGVSRRTIHYWIDSGQLDRDLATGQTRYSPRPAVGSQLDPIQGDHRSAAAGVSEAVGAAIVRRGQRGRLRGRLQPGQGLRTHGSSAGATRSGRTLRDAGRTTGGQVDFGRFVLPWGSRYALVVVLSHSRLLWPVPCQDLGLSLSTSRGALQRMRSFRLPLTRDIQPGNRRLSCGVTTRCLGSGSLECRDSRRVYRLRPGVRLGGSSGGCAGRRVAGGVRRWGEPAAPCSRRRKRYSCRASLPRSGAVTRIRWPAGTSPRWRRRVSTVKSLLPRRRGPHRRRSVPWSGRWPGRRSPDSAVRSCDRCSRSSSGVSGETVTGGRARLTRGTSGCARGWRWWGRRRDCSSSGRA